MTAPTTEKQSNALHGPNLILDVENFGPIAEAKNIEFKPMTVFVGPSNTGKTYLAMLLHSVLRSESKIGWSGSISDGGYHIYDDSRYWVFADEMTSWVESTLDDSENRGASVFFDVPLPDFEKESQAFLVDATKRYLENYTRISSRTIAEYFDVRDLSQLTNLATNGHNSLAIALRDNAQLTDMSISDYAIKHFVPYDEIGISVDVDEEAATSDEAMRRFLETLDFEFEIEYFAKSSIRHFPTSHYFRAGRTGLMDAYRELAATLIEIAATSSRRSGRPRQLSVALATSEFLQAIVRIRPNSVPRFRRPIIDKLADVLEMSVLGGKINAKATAGISYFEFEKDGVAIPLDRASSMVTELAPIVLFIRYFVKDRDILIIDEPEAHLHPEAQQQMAAALAFMVRSGLRVLITTHSHYMVEQLSAFVNASKLDEKTRKRALALGGALGKEDIYLNEDETAVYSFAFSEEHSGSVVKEIFMGEEYEYGPDDHSDATVDQFNRLQRVLEARETAESNGVD